MLLLSLSLFILLLAKLFLTYNWYIFLNNFSIQFCITTKVLLIVISFVFDFNLLFKIIKFNLVY